MDVYGIRLKRVREIVASDRFGGNKGQFADAIGRKRPNVYRLLSGTASDRRAIGEDLARDIEKRLKLPAGFLDREDAEPSALTATEPTPEELAHLERWRGLFDHQRAELSHAIDAQLEIARKVIAEMKRRGLDKFVPDDEVAKHIKPSPQQQELPIPLKVPAKSGKRHGRGT